MKYLAMIQLRLCSKKNNQIKALMPSQKILIKWIVTMGTIAFVSTGTLKRRTAQGVSITVGKFIFSHKED